MRRGLFPTVKSVQTMGGGPGSHSTIPHCCNMDTLCDELQGK